MSELTTPLETERSLGLGTPTPDPSPQGGGELGGNAGESPSPLRGGVRGKSHQKATLPSWDTPPDRLVVFDGVCVLCSFFVRFILRFDREKRFRFVTAQSPLGESLFRTHGLRTDIYETNLVLIDGKPSVKFDSFLATCDALGWPWRVLVILRLLPCGLRDWLYDRVAKNRYAIFGKQESCEIPSAELRERLIG